MNEFIQHGGPGSGRYPLGSGGRPYQKFEKAKRKIGSISNYIKKKKNESAQKKVAKSKANAEKARASAEKARAIHEADRERVLKKGTAREVMRYQGELTNKELQDAFTRLNLEANIRRLSEDEKYAKVKKVDKVMKTVGDVTGWVKTGTEAYNSMAAIYNATPEGRTKPMTIVTRGNRSSSSST